MIEIKYEGRTYSASAFAKEFGLSYSRVLRNYKKGYRDAELYAASINKHEIKINDHVFPSKHAAAIHYGIPSSTFYRRLHQGKLYIDDFDGSKAEVS
ncbi:hypothetical protein FOD75_10810 (plasmid) [Limosilactobacillus reuteri]|uniref:Uncharacterized protein n=1 Tax=Limosilactobacillus reuteri TaxID=1598 RepID=A0A517D8A0_LIMRT|nr:hypothetical protein [Limosilactobacillus reuteri]QDR73581.1 hypothetical protein FOD75_10810 [Limosilactobacillus reuteri]